MNGPEHYRLAQEFLHRASTVLVSTGHDPVALDLVPPLIALGQAHATLALAAAAYDALNHDGVPAEFPPHAARCPNGGGV